MSVATADAMPRRTDTGRHRRAARVLRTTSLDQAEAASRAVIADADREDAAAPAFGDQEFDAYEIHLGCPRLSAHAMD